MKEKQESAYEREQASLLEKEERTEDYGDGLLISFLDYFTSNDNN